MLITATCLAKSTGGGGRKKLTLFNKFMVRQEGRH